MTNTPNRGNQLIAEIRVLVSNLKSVQVKLQEATAKAKESRGATETTGQDRRS